MGTFNPAVDVYIAAAKPFAQPILNHIRELVHAVCPEVTEVMKWQFPHFDYLGMMCSMAAFKEHCTFGFWKATLMPDPEHLMKVKADQAMGHFGQLRSLADLPTDEVMRLYLSEAIRLNVAGIKLPPKPKASEPRELVIPDYFRQALQQDAVANQVFESYSYSHKKEYLEWVTEAKTEKTRLDRLAKTIALLRDRKSLNWKYESSK